MGVTAFITVIFLKLVIRYNIGMSHRLQIEGNGVIKAKGVGNSGNVLLYVFGNLVSQGIL